MNLCDELTKISGSLSSSVISTGQVLSGFQGTRMCSDLWSLKQIQSRICGSLLTIQESSIQNAGAYFPILSTPRITLNNLLLISGPPRLVSNFSVVPITPPATMPIQWDTVLQTRRHQMSPPKPTIQQLHDAHYSPRFEYFSPPSSGDSPHDLRFNHVEPVRSGTDVG
jgi:hypothetical protein